MKQSDLIFTLYPIQPGSGNYFHLELVVWVPRYGPATYDHDSTRFADPRDYNSVTLRWQWGDSSQHQFWYGFGIKPLHGGDFNNLDDMAFCMEVARKAIPVLKTEYGSKYRAEKPEDIIAHLLKVGTYVVRDRRDGGLYRPEDVRPEGEYYYCVSSGTVPGQKYGMGHAWATPENAVQAVYERIVADKGEDTARAWINVGSPVHLLNTGTPPDLRSPLDRLNPYGD